MKNQDEEIKQLRQQLTSFEEEEKQKQAGEGEDDEDDPYAKERQIVMGGTHSPKTSTRASRWTS